MTPEGIGSSEILRPKNLSEAANDIFGPVKETHHLLTDELVTAKMAKILMDGVRILAEIREFNLDSLKDEDQKSQFVLFLSSLSSLIKPILPPSPSELPASTTESATEIEINPHPIDLTLNSPDLQKPVQTIHLKEQQKIMLAYFAALTQAKIDRYEIPWITRKQLATLTPEFTIDPLRDHLLEPLRKIGLLEVNPHSRFGSRLNCDPTEVLKILKEENAQPSLNITDYDTWIKDKEKAGHILIESYQLPFLRVMYDYCQQPSTRSSRLDRDYLEQKTRLGRPAVYHNLQVLQNLGLIWLVGGFYTVEGVNLKLLAKIINAQEQPINITIKTRGIQPTEEKQPTTHLPPIKVEAPKPLKFPKIAWEETAEVAEINFTPATILPQIDQIISTPLSKAVIGQRDNKYAGLFPQVEDLDQPTILAVLDYLGVGPQELQAIMKKADERWGLGQAIVDFEKRTQSTRSEADQLLIFEIKSRLGDLISVSLDEVKKSPFSDLLRLMDVKLNEIQDNQQEKTLEKKTVSKPEVAKPVVNEKLLELMREKLTKEITFASNPQLTPLKPDSYVPPTTAFNYHDKLSDGRSLIPWGALSSLGLAKIIGRDQHHVINSAGMLVAALYLNEDIHNQVKAKRSEKKALRILAIHTAHLLKEKGEEVKQQMEQGKTPQVPYQYIETCLSCLDKAGLSCQCEKCLE